MPSSVPALKSSIFEPEKKGKIFACFNTRDNNPKFVDLVISLFSYFQGYEELLSVSTTGRPIRLVEVDVTRSELSLSRSEAISALLHPSALTVLDDGIGCALWFAARGRGTISGRPYDSPARVLLVGTGADEQFGGYTRHRARYEGRWGGCGK